MGPMDSPQIGAYRSLWLDYFHASLKVERQATWLYNLTAVCYHALYLPLLYVTFMADFFQEEDMLLENVYYSEMKDAGFFDADWD
ncbi:unnamed protein product [Triticum turgidum subsp. durum]|uniref:Uncharacterized protein n=1 Tax=Triticum turgidum subsp. durum TaxID=4567 RepID=A0A9R0XHH9_TRITD|nr:unnamed protein product [Triticum turgidum subsp. durum]